MGRPKASSLVGITFLLLVTILCFLSSHHQVSEPVHRRPSVAPGTASTNLLPKLRPHQPQPQPQPQPQSGTQTPSQYDSAPQQQLELAAAAAARQLASSSNLDPSQPSAGEQQQSRSEPIASRLVNLSCAKAGPHWRKELPKTTSTAVELLPVTDDQGLAPNPRYLQPFELRQVTLTAGTHVARAAATNLRYLLSLPVDGLLWAWRKNAGLSQPAGARPLRGWEAPGSELRGHILGHWLSASAFSVASVRDDPTRRELQGRIGYVLGVLRQCQAPSGWLAAFPESFLDRVEALTPVWAPYYTLHKLLQGLLDQSEVARSAAALPMARRLAQYIGERVARLVERRGMSYHWETLNKEVSPAKPTCPGPSSTPNP